MKKILFIIAVLAPGATLWAEDEKARDAFVREVVVTLLQTQAAHVSPQDTVDRAYLAWQRYQELIRETKASE